MVHILPVYSGQFIATVKLTSIAGYIAVVDLTKASDIIRSRTFEAFFPLLFTALVYFLISALLVLVLRLIENRITPGRHPINKNILSVVSSFDGAITDIQDITNKSDSGKKKNDVMLEIEHLKKSFGDVTPIKDVSCKVQKGDVISIIGPSGTGKSTFLNLINRLEFPDGGHIVFEGNDTSEKTYDLNIMREKVGMVFQSFNLFSHLTVIENLMLAQTELLNRSEEEACRKSIELLKMVGMSDKALCFPSQLSGGQQQRTAIGRAIVKNPDILLCDEPTGALDYNTSREILKLIETGNQKYGNTIIMVTHNDAIKDMADRVVRLRDGQIRDNVVNGTKIPAAQLEW
jgi:ABC-type polar amino acid transport system ATPase subunit